MAAPMARALVRRSCNFVRSAVNRNAFQSNNLDNVTSAARVPELCTIFQRCIHVTSPTAGLMEFFDDKENWGQEKVKAGRPWAKDELRLKSNQDLHKLWYVLLKERNMLMTMAAEYERQVASMPAPERLEKVEESMENLLDVVAERDRAYSLLETGQTGEPGSTLLIDPLGRYYVRHHKEYHMPVWANQRVMAIYRRRRATWQKKYLMLYREKLMKDKTRRLRQNNQFVDEMRRALGLSEDRKVPSGHRRRHMNPILEEELH